MPRNTIKGTNKRPKSNKATGRDYKKEAATNKKNQKKRQALNKIARKKGEYGKKHKRGVDRSHKKDGSTVLEKRSANRARQGANGKSTKK